jgi:hypothetical protein
MGVLSWPKRSKPGKPAKQAGPVDRALEWARDNEHDLLGVIAGDDEDTFFAFAAHGRVPTDRLIDESEMTEDGQHSRTYVLELTGRKPIRIIAAYATGIGAYDEWREKVPASEHLGMRAALMMSEARYLLGAFPALVDARSLLPLLDISALENPYWHDPAFGEARRGQLLSFALCISQPKYAQLQEHPSMAGLPLYSDGILALAKRMFDMSEITE